MKAKRPAPEKRDAASAGVMPAEKVNRLNPQRPARKNDLFSNVSSPLEWMAD